MYRVVMHHEVVFERMKQLPSVFTPCRNKSRLCWSLLRLAEHLRCRRMRIRPTATEEQLHLIFRNIRKHHDHFFMESACATTHYTRTGPRSVDPRGIIMAAEISNAGTRSLADSPSSHHHYPTNSTITVPFFNPATSIVSSLASIRFFPIETNSKSVPSLPSKGSAFRNS